MNNIEIIKQYHEKIWGEKNLNAIDEYFSNEAQIESPVKSTKGTEEMKQVISSWHEGFPNLKVHWDDYICEGDKVVSRWHATGLQEGNFLGNNPSKKEINYSGVTIYQLEDAKITKYWAMVDMDTLKNQL